MLKAAIENGNEQTFALSLKSYILPQENRNGRTFATPVNANETLAEGEFNRFYIRALCVRAQKEDKNLIIYRAKPVSVSRPESERLIGTTISVIKQLLDDLRNNKFFDQNIGLPSGPNSGLSVMLSLSLRH